MYIYTYIKGNFTKLPTHLVFFSLDRLYLYSGCRKMGLNNSSWVLEASEFPSALGFKFSYQMRNEVTVIKNVVVLKHARPCCRRLNTETRFRSCK